MTDERKPNGALIVIAHLCAIIVAAYFIYAAHGKIKDPRQFAIQINNYRILPSLYVHLPAIFLPWWELGAAVALIVPRTRRAGAVLIGGLLLFFIVAVGYSALYKGLDISCGCTGQGSAKAGWWTILRNLAFLACTLASVYLPSWRRRCASIRAASVDASLGEAH